MREGTFKRRLVEQAAMAPDQWALDLGAGAGTLAVLAGISDLGTEIV